LKADLGATKGFFRHRRKIAPLLWREILLEQKLLIQFLGPGGNMKKVMFFLLLAAAAFSMLYANGQKADSSAAQTAEEDPNYVVKIGRGITTGLCGSPFVIAEVNGYFEAEGLKFEMVTIGTGESQMAITTGKIDATSGLMATTIQPLANGFDIKIPLGIHTGCQKVVVRPDSGINTPADLKGKKIGTSGMAASGTVVAQRYLASLGIGVAPPKLEVDWVIYQSADLPLALERGQVDAIALGDPSAYLIEKEGNGKVIINQATDDYLKDEFCCVVQLATAFVEKYPLAAAKFTRAIQKAAAWVQENPVETATILKESKGVAGEIEDNAAILRTYNYKASVSEARIAISRNVNDLKAIGLISADVDGDDLTKRVFVALDGVPDNLYGLTPRE
jgi:NitT/TauT family transport system substrate-binding protein